MLYLILDIMDRFRNMRYADSERSVARLPTKVPQMD